MVSISPIGYQTECICEFFVLGFERKCNLAPSPLRSHQLALEHGPQSQLRQLEQPQLALRVVGVDLRMDRD
jgi:hypothetical protein